MAVSKDTIIINGVQYKYEKINGYENVKNSSWGELEGRPKVDRMYCVSCGIVISDSSECSYCGRLLEML